MVRGANGMRRDPCAVTCAYPILARALLRCLRDVPVEKVPGSLSLLLLLFFLFHSLSPQLATQIRLQEASLAYSLSFSISLLLPPP